MFQTAKTTFQIQSKVWKSSGKGGWHFITIEKSKSDKIRKKFHLQEEGWGRLRVEITFKDSFWSSSVWFDSQKQCYLLPIKSEIRIKNKIKIGDMVKLKITIIE